MTDEETVDPVTLRASIGPVTEPVSTRELLDAAIARGQSERVLATLRRLPERQWATVRQAVAAATSGFVPDGESDSPGAET